MRIGIDASRSIEGFQKTGVEKISDQLLQALQLQFREAQADVVYYTSQRIDWLPFEQQNIISFPRFWTVIRLSWEMLFYKPDIFFSPVHELPFFCPTKTFRYIHDVAFLKHQKSYSWFQRWYLRFGLNRSLRICTKIFVATEAVKDDLVQLTTIDSAKIVVTGFGYERKYKISSTEHKERRRKQILYIGRIEEKKNLESLIKAFELFSKNNPDYTLVLAGKDGYGAEEIKKQIKNSKAQINVLGYISEEKKWQLLAESTVLCLISKAEGFGIPILEGFDAGIPVLAADIPVLREVGGGACVYVDPDNIDGITRGLAQIVSEGVDSQYITKGTERLKLFDWQQVVAVLCVHLC